MTLASFECPLAKDAFGGTGEVCGSSSMGGAIRLCCIYERFRSDIVKRRIHTTHLVVHDWNFEQLTYRFVFSELIPIRSKATSLKSDGRSDESSKHVEFGPINLVGIIWLEVRIPFVCTPQIRCMNFPKNLF